jgi:hypothetical protein
VSLHNICYQTLRLWAGSARRRTLDPCDYPDSCAQQFSLQIGDVSANVAF